MFSRNMFRNHVTNSHKKQQISNGPDQTAAYGAVRSGSSIFSYAFLCFCKR